MMWITPSQSSCLIEERESHVLVGFGLLLLLGSSRSSSSSSSSGGSSSSRGSTTSGGSSDIADQALDAALGKKLGEEGWPVGLNLHIGGLDNGGDVVCGDLQAIIGEDQGLDARRRRE